MLVTTQQAADAWGMSPNSVKKLIATGVLHGVVLRGVRSTLPVEDVQALADRPRLWPSDAGVVELPVLRVKAAEAVTDDDPSRGREWQGFHAGLSASDLWDALRGWWRGDPEKITAAGFLTVTVSGFAVAVLVDLEVDDSRAFPTASGKTELRHWFSGRLGGHVVDLVAPRILLAADQSEHDVELVRRILGNRVEARSGGPIAYARTLDDSARAA